MFGLDLLCLDLARLRFDLFRSVLFLLGLDLLWLFTRSFLDCYSYLYLCVLIDGPGGLDLGGYRRTRGTIDGLDCFVCFVLYH